MIAHLIGCPNASKEAKKVATKLKKGSAPDSTDDGESDDDEKSDGPPLKRTRGSSDRQVASYAIVETFRRRCPATSRPLNTEVSV
jgi:hypothetical protein